MRCRAPLVGIDTETHLIENKYQIPLGVVAGVCSGKYIQLIMWEYWREYFTTFLEVNPTVKLVFFNGGFDEKVIGEDIFIPELAKENRVMELRANYRQSRIANQGWFPGSTTLGSITKEVTGVVLDKESGVRVSYRRGKPITADQEHYLCDDAISTFLSGMAYDGIPTESIQARASWVLSEISRNGIYIDTKYVRELVAKYSAELEELAVVLKGFGFRVKEETADLTQKQRIMRVYELFGAGELSDVINKSDFKQLPKYWLKMACAVVYSILEPGGAMVSDLRKPLNDLLQVLLDNPKPTGAVKKFYDSLEERLRQILADMECVECLDGCGEAKARSSTPFIVFLETLADHFSKGTTLKGMEAFRKDFYERHEENFGWLPTAEKKLSPSAFIQQHLRDLMAQHPGLKFPYTQSSEKKIRKRCRDAQKEAKKTGVTTPVDISDLEKFQLKGDDMWLLEDLDIKDPFLDAYFAYKHKEKLLSTYVTEKYIEADGRVHSRFEILLRTGRTSSTSPNVQNLPKEAGLREMYTAPKGKVLISCDYGPTSILHTQAELWY